MKIKFFNSTEAAACGRGAYGFTAALTLVVCALGLILAGCGESSTGGGGPPTTGRTVEEKRKRNTRT
ncbi:MAG: hypothetical protein LBG74_08130, partial [Spirochaetaceae bacterium]|nr:hypothetical protein [Spirochaetaceae bacterium]